MRLTHTRRGAITAPEGAIRGPCMLACRKLGDLRQTKHYYLRYPIQVLLLCANVLRSGATKREFSLWPRTLRRRRRRRDGAIRGQTSLHRPTRTFVFGTLGQHRVVERFRLAIDFSAPP